MPATFHASIHDLPAAAWDSLANPPAAERNPFVAHAFLAALEDSGCVGAGTGWAPHHLALHDAQGQLVAAAPCYLKSHSLGEYVFDHGWADALHRAGGRYYPKLQVAVPFTPVAGPRLLAGSGEQRAALLAALPTEAARLRASSVHVTFLPDPDWQALGTAPWLRQSDVQFHWRNRGYGSFEGFLADLSHSKRKQIRRERRDVAAAGVQCRWLRGAEISESHWDAFFAFYQDTGSRKWGRPYLNRRFFSLLGAALGPDVLLLVAERGGRAIGGSLHVLGSHALFGRYWGATEHVPFLHFEACYYQAIDWAIAHRLPRVEAGAQGPHKLLRGYLPVATRSLHWMAHAGLHTAVAEHLQAQHASFDDYLRQLALGGPFRAQAAGDDDGL